MTHMLLFATILCALILEGAVLARLILRERFSLLTFSLGLPLAAFVNVLLAFRLTVTRIPLTPLSLGGVHGALLGVLLFIEIWKFRSDQCSNGITEHNIYAEFSVYNFCSYRPAVLLLCSAILSAVFLSSAAHAVLLPTFQYDSATNWNMRSNISFTERRIVFEESRTLGVNKPTYPFLYHALQVTTSQGQPRWNDRFANAAHFFLNWSAIAALFLLAARLRGRTVSALMTTILAGTPLMAVHLGGGFADITLVLLSILALATLAAGIESREGRWILLSAFFASAGVWTKTEGFFFLLIPWLITTMIFQRQSGLRAPVHAIILAIVLALPWPVFAVAKGLGLTPHGSGDIALVWDPSAPQALVRALFLDGSFGLLWYTLPVALFLLIRKRKTLDRRLFPTLLPGILPLAQTLAIYLFTPNVQYLLNGQSFSRQMLTPLALLILAAAFLLTPPIQQEEADRLAY